MINKAEFLERVKKEFSRKDEYKSIDIKKRLKGIKRNTVGCIVGALLVLFFALSDGVPIGEAVCLVAFIFIFLMVTELKKQPTSFAFLKNSGLCKPFWVKTEPTREEIDENSRFLNQYEKPIWSLPLRWPGAISAQPSEPVWPPLVPVSVLVRLVRVPWKVWLVSPKLAATSAPP